MRSKLLMLLLLGVSVSAQTAQPNLTLPVGSAKVVIDVLSPAQTIRVENLPTGTLQACTLFASMDELLDGQPYVPRHCWFAESEMGFEGHGYDEDWDFIKTGHTYDISVEYEVKAGVTDVEWRTEAVRVTHLEYVK